MRADEGTGDGDDEREMTMIFGTKVSVISWTWVSAWISAMIVPTSIAAPTAGPDATMMVQIARLDDVKGVPLLRSWLAQGQSGSDHDLGAVLEQRDRAVGVDGDRRDLAGHGECPWCR